MPPNCCFSQRRIIRRLLVKKVSAYGDPGCSIKNALRKMLWNKINFSLTVFLNFADYMNYKRGICSCNIFIFSLRLNPAGLLLVALIHACVSAVVHSHQRAALSCVRFAFMINACRLIYLRAQQLGSPNQASINCAQKLERESEKRER